MLLKIWTLICAIIDSIITLTRTFKRLFIFWYLLFWAVFSDLFFMFNGLLFVNASLWCFLFIDVSNFTLLPSYWRLISVSSYIWWAVIIDRCHYIVWSINWRLFYCWKVFGNIVLILRDIPTNGIYNSCTKSFNGQLCVLSWFVDLTKYFHYNIIYQSLIYLNLIFRG